VNTAGPPKRWPVLDVWTHIAVRHSTLLNKPQINCVHLYCFMLLLSVSAATASHRQAVQVAVIYTSLSKISLYHHLVVVSLTLLLLQTIVTLTTQCWYNDISDSDVLLIATCTPWWWLASGAEMRKNNTKDRCTQLVYALLITDRMHGTNSTLRILFPSMDLMLHVSVSGDHHEALNIKII
jgi:hypothetical protein